MLRMLGVALISGAGLLLTAAGETPAASANFQAATPVPSQVELAALTPAPQLPRAVADDGDDSVAAAEAPAALTPESLRELVASIAALPSVELSSDVRCLATAVYFESKGEPIEGQLAVAQVILNRVDSGRFASSACGVIRQAGQFSFAYRTPAAGTDWRIAQAVAVVAATGNWREVAPDATYFHAKRVAPGWGGLRRVSAIGNHIFYARR